MSNDEIEDLQIRYDSLQTRYEELQDKHAVLERHIVLLNGQINDMSSLLLELQQDRIMLSKINTRMMPIIRDLAVYGVGGFLPVEHVATAQQIVAEMDAPKEITDS